MTAGNKLKIQKPNTFVFVLRSGVLLAWVITIVWLSLTPSPPQISGVLGWDKLLHAGAYGLLSLLIAQFLFYTPLKSHKIWLYAWLAAIFFGAVMEIMQLLVQTGRVAEWWDLFADAVGALLACVIFRQVFGLVWPGHEAVKKDHG